MLQPPIQNVSAAADTVAAPTSDEQAVVGPQVPAPRVVPQLRVPGTQPMPAGAPQPAVNPQFPGVDPGVRLWRVGDPKDTRQSIYDAVLQATAKMPPIVSKQYTLQLADPHYAEDDPDFNANDDKQAMLERRSLSRRLRGTWQLLDNESGQMVSERKATIANVPAILRDGTFLRTGTRYAMGYQQRLRPGIYTRFKNSGEPESHCFHSSVKIWTEFGMISIREIVRKRLAVRVWSYDFATEQFVLRPIVNWYRNKIAGGIDVARYSAPGRLPTQKSYFFPETLKGTASHQVFQRDGSKKELASAKYLMSVREIPAYSQRQVLLGSLLGDGHINSQGIYEETHALEQEVYLRWKADAMATWVTTAGVCIQTTQVKAHRQRGKLYPAATRTYARFNTVASSYLHDVRTHCYDATGKRVVSDWWLNQVDELGLAMWYCDDGSVSRIKNQHGQTNCLQVAIATQGYSTSCVDKLLAWLASRWGVEARRYRNGNEEHKQGDGWYIVVTREDAERFLRIVAPYVHPSLVATKLPARPITAACVSCGKEIRRQLSRCNSCAAGTGCKTYRSRRFGGLSRAAVLSRPIPADTTPGADWDALMSLVGSGLPAAAADISVGHELHEVPVKFERGMDGVLSKCTVAYDIEVAGTHNYFANGMLVSNCNAKARSGRSHRYVLEPETGLFSVHVEHAKIPLVPLLDVLGVSREQVEATWGKELADKNYAKSDPKALGKYYERFVPKFEQTPEDRADPDRMKEKVREAIGKIEIDEAVVEKTLGRPSRTLDADLILRATGKSLRLLQGKEDADDRDNLGFASYHSAADILAERFTNDYGKFRRELLYKAARKGDLASVPSGALDKYINAAIFRSGLGQTVEDVNPAEIAAAARKITRFGEGGLPDTQSAPAEARDVSPSQFGFIDPILTPESLRVGIDGVLSRNTFLGSDNKLYREMLDGKTGQKIFRSPDQLMRSSVAIGAAPLPGFEMVIAGGKVKMGREGTADYRLPSMDDVFSDSSSLVPMKSAMYGQRGGMGSRMSGQAISLVNPEAPLVQSGVAGDGDESYEERFGEMMGAMRAKERGRVVEVRPTHVTLKYAGGREEKMYLDNNRPGARKTIYHQDPVVEMGQEVEPGQLIARSNHTDANGVTALGTNARMALMAWDDAWEDNIVVSRSFAERTKIQQAYRYGVEPGNKEAVAKRDYLQLFGSRYKDTQLKTIGDDGVIKPGTVVRENDPLILAVRQRDTAQSRVHKQNKMDWSDTSIRWDHAHEGVVTDVVRGKHGVQVVVKTAKPLEDGDKLAGRWGNKGVIAIKEDNEMPHDESGQALDAVISPLAIPSRGNSSFPIEMILGKIAKKTGVPYKIKDFTGEDMREFAEQEALRHGVKDVETVTDPVTGRKIPNVLVGNSFMMVLHHMAASKTSGRGLGKYTGTDAPARGPEEGAQAKRYSGQQMWAGMSHGAYNMSAEATLLRGTRNTDYWSAFMAGESVGEPKIPVQYESFLNRLRGAGINPVRSGTKTRLMALIDSDVRELAGDRVVTSSDTVDLDNDMRPIKNGLFDPKLFGDGDRFAAIKLSEPMPNPIFEEPLRRILGVTEKDFREVVAGRKQLEGYGTGSQGLKKKLESLDLDVEIRKAREAIGGTRKVARDDAVRRLKYLKGLKETDTNPVDLMLSRVPVLPPRLRPISKMANKQGVIVHDANYLYRELMEADKVLDELKGVSDDTGDERLAVYDNYKAVVGLTEPNNRELRQRKVKGLLKRIVGDSPKSGEVQRRLLSGNVDTIGRGVIAPDTSLDMDSFGLPERLAFKMYEPYLVRNMVSTGIPRVQAMEHLKAQDEVARRALLVEIDKRPVTVSRAPILHKYGDIALKPRLVKGDTIRLNPVVFGPMGGDADGNCVDYDEVIVLALSVSALYHAGSEFLASMQEAVSMRLTEAELVTIQSGTDVRRVVQLKIGQFPRVGEPSEPKPGQLMYDVPPGVLVLSYQHDTGEPVWSPVTTFTVDKRHKVVRVKTNRKREVKVSDNESLAVLNETTLTLERVKPAGSEGRFMAMIKKIPIEGVGGDFDAGWLQAAMIANGWSSAAQLVGYAHNCLQAREKVVELVKRYWGDNFAHTEYADSGAHANKFSPSVKRHLTGPSVRGKCDDIVHPDIQKYRDRQEHWVKPRTGDAPWAKNVRPALFKRIPPKLFLEWGEEAWLGLLCGYLENDGTLGRVAKAKGGEQARIAIHTSSPYLYEGMQHVLRMLGIRYSSNIKGATDSSHPGYSLTLSNIDVDKLILSGKLRFYTPEAQEWLRWRTNVAASGKANDSIDVVPVPDVVRGELLLLVPDKALRLIISEAGKQRSLGRMRAKRLAAAVDATQASDTLKRWIQLANNDDIHWDRVKTVEDVGVMDVYDIGVPETKVFAINNGLVIWDTVNLNLPHSRKAVHEALTRMLPSKMLMSVKDFDKAVFMPTQDLMFGLNRASRPARTDVQTRYFVSLADAKAAYARGDIDLDTPVKIGRK